MKPSQLAKFVLIPAFIFLLSFQSSFSQNISGIVSDLETNTPLPGVNIYFQDKISGTTTDGNGKYTLLLPKTFKESDAITFSFIGYKTLKITLPEFKKTNYSILMEKETQEIGEISIYENINLTPTLRYKKVSKMKSALYGFGAFIHDNKIYVIAGDESTKTDNNLKTFDEQARTDNTSFAYFLAHMEPEIQWTNYSDLIQIYDINKDEWIKNNLRFRKRAYHNVECYGNTAYVIGGKNLSKNRRQEYLDKSIEIFDTEKDSITIDQTNPHQAINFASAMVGDNLLVAGGSTNENKIGHKEYTNTVHLLQLNTGLWYELAPMPEAKECKGIFVKNKFYTLGGFKEKPLNTIESYNFVNDTWKVEGSLFDNLKSPALAHDSATIYAFENGKFYTLNTQTGEQKKYLIDLNLYDSSMFLHNDKLYIVGGYKDADFDITPSEFIYSIDLAEFNRTKVFQSSYL